MTRPDYLLDIPAEDYHKATKDGLYLSSHRLAIFRKCPLEYYQRVHGIMADDGDTAAFRLGRATHALILEGRKAFDEQFICAEGPINERTGKPYGSMTDKYIKWAEAQTRPVIAPADFAEIEAMGKAVAAHEIAAGLIRDGFAEGVVRTEFDGVPVQSRLDWYNPDLGRGGLIVDLKTCRDLDRFARFDVRDFGYIEQLAFYARAVAQAREADLSRPSMPFPECWLIAVEKQAPYRVGAWVITEGSMTSALAANRLAISEMKKCTAEDKWPTRFENYGEL